MSGSDSDLDFESADEDTEFACSSKSNVCQKSISEDAPCESVLKEGDDNSKISTSEIVTGTNKDERNNMSSKQHSSSDVKETVEGSAKVQPADLSDASNKMSTSDIETNEDECTKMSSMQNFSGGLKYTVTDSTKVQHADKLSSEQQLSSVLKDTIEDSVKPDKSQDTKVSETDSIQNPDGALPETELKPHQKTDSLYEEADALSTKCVSELKPASSLPTEENSSKNRTDVKPMGESKPARERVVLRLEKKKQLAKESPVESEKPSDFVNILQDPEEKREPTSWGFSSWGSSLLSSAASSVSTFSNQVSQGIGSVLDTVESTLGAPTPEDLAQTLNEKKAETKDATNAEEEKGSEGRSGLLPDMSSWTKVLENTGSTVLMGGLNTLELIGKKTMDILTEGDPGLRNKRAAFSGDANLSELLREIKARADEQSKESCEDDAENLHYSQIFDEKQGLVHLEALEMLSKQSQAKFQRLLMRHAKHSEVKKRLQEIKAICENIPSLDEPADCESFEDFEAVFQKYTLGLCFPLNVDNIIRTQRQISERISNYENAAEDSHSPPKEIFQSAICSLADFTAKCIETFHKAAELILVQPNLDPDLEHCATNLTGLTTVMCTEVNNLSSRYHKCLETTTECLQKKGISENADVKTLATNVYVEASNSNNYIQDAYQMLVPVLQVRFLEAID